ncbi:zinc finger protein 830 [Drosophila busckii]|uniref:zinc finger protein 830 n=1 Tax=Drosophila busckii TaxID=30019 RepID=UPI001433310F|nr:zinc finger protein 830 [Drosophila busckii]
MNRNKDFLKTNSKIRKNPELKQDYTKLNSPIAKFDSAGNLSCVLCRIPIKVNVWKVHLNSKQHKLSVELAKNQRSEIGINKPNKQTTKLKVSNSANSTIKSSIDRAPEVSNLIGLQDAIKVKENADQTNTVPNALPDKFFDVDKSTNVYENDREANMEWQKFQREIKEVDAISNIIETEEQDSTNIKRHLKEIDEQLENWKRFIKINDKKNTMSSKKRRPKTYNPDFESSSSDDSFTDNLLDWRIKNIKKKPKIS